MRASPMLAAAILLLTGCGGGSTSGASHSPTPTASASASSAPSPSPSASPTAGPAALVHCTVPVPAGDNLVIGKVVGDPTVVVRDIQDPSNAKNLCTFDSTAQAPQFVSASAVAYETPDNKIIRADLSTGATTVLATYAASPQPAAYAISPDGASVSYLDGNSWRVSGPNGSKLLSTLPAQPARGVTPDEDDLFLKFSPDGQYIALFQTFHVGGSGETAPDQIRRAGDGSLVYSTTGMTMAVWASVPSRLFFRDSSGNVHRWDPSAGLSSMLTIHWIGPRASSDGRWIAYTFRTAASVGGIGFYSVQSNTVSNTSPPGRSGVQFLTNDLAWYIGERACATCFGGLPTPTGVTYIYDIAGATEVVSRLTGVYDAWPHMTTPGL